MKRAISCISGCMMLAGCQAVPHAPVIYASNWSVGLVAEQAASDPLPTINLGVQIEDAAWVPAISCTQLTSKGKETDEPCIARMVYAEDQDENRFKGDRGKKDAFSVFGTFNSRSTVTGRTAASDNKPAVPLGASVTAGKVFSTGVAADKIASASGPAHYKACLESVTRDLEVSTNVAGWNDALAVCDVEKYEIPPPPPAGKSQADTR
jgi:hypothetical protein